MKLISIKGDKNKRQGINAFFHRRLRRKESLQLLSNSFTINAAFFKAMHIRLLHMNKLSLWFNCSAVHGCALTCRKNFLALISPLAFSDGRCTIYGRTRSRSSTCSRPSSSGSSTSRGTRSSTSRATCSSWSSTSRPTRSSNNSSRCGTCG